MCMSVTFPTCKRMFRLSAYIFFLVPGTLSLSKFTCLFHGFSACRHQVSPLSSVSAGLMGQKQIDLLHAGCGNHNTHAKKMHVQLRP